MVFVFKDTTTVIDIPIVSTTTGTAGNRRFPRQTARRCC